MKIGKKLLGYILLLTTALIWGLAFVVQYYAGSYIEVIALNGIRYWLATIVIGIVLIFYYLINKKKGKNIKLFTKDTLLWGVFSGIALFLGNNTQQWGLNLSSVANSSFITTLYIIMVPLLGVFMRKKPPQMILYAIPIAVLGFWLICMSDSFSIAFGDLISFLSALCFALQITFIALGVKKGDPFGITFVQFVVAALISIPAMAISGFPTSEAVEKSIWLLLYIGILSAAGGFLLQSIGQSFCEESIASLIMSLESVFALIFATIIIKEEHSAKELLGCLFVFIAAYLAQQEKNEPLLKYQRRKFFVE